MLQIITVFACLALSGCLGFASSHPKLNPRIVGGDPVDISEHPHQLSLQPYYTHSCGGSIIGRKWAVTAAHCPEIPMYYYRVGAGGNYWRELTWYNVTRFIPHPLYNSTSDDYDIALIKVEGEFKYGKNVQPIKLAERDLEPDEIVNITGWGRISEIGFHSDELLRSSIPIVSRDVCRKAYASQNPHLSHDITSRMICAGDIINGGRDSCQGDSGGPLSANGTLYGIVSWGRGCGRSGFPSVYTNVANLRQWIHHVTGI